jgi:hypothetical protein
MFFAVFLFFLQFIMVKNSLSYGGMDECSPGLVPRVDCKDLMDLPLCSLFSDSDQKTKSDTQDNMDVNCVEECNDPFFNNKPHDDALRGIDYAIHNKDCVRFCDGGIITEENGDDVSETDITKNCTPKKCHQLSIDETPNSGDGGNCELLGCSLLELEELQDNWEEKTEGSFKYGDEDKEYCLADQKCYEFSDDKWKYLRVRKKNPTCIIHTCTPTSTECGIDETTLISNVNKYTDYIDPGFGTNNSLCEPAICYPTTYKTHRCLPVTDPVPTEEASECTTNCVDGYCQEELDCNIDEYRDVNSSEYKLECAIGSDDDEEDSVVTISHQDYGFDHHSWFYRPRIDSKQEWKDDGVLSKLQDISPQNMCYERKQLEDNWGENLEIDMGLFTIPLGYSLNGFSHEIPGGLCDTSKDGLRGVGYAYLCRTDGDQYAEPEEDAGYNSGYVRTDYSDNSNSKYYLDVCLRYKNSFRLNACGKRECGVDCLFDACWVQWCGQDKCRTLMIEENNPKECVNPEENTNSNCTSDMGWGVDDLTKLRIVKYGRRVCSFLDLEGTFAYDPDYLSPLEYDSLLLGLIDYYKGPNPDYQLEDGTCIDGGGSDGQPISEEVLDYNGDPVLDDNGEPLTFSYCKGGFNSNDNAGSLYHSRAIMFIKHSLGYTDYYGRYFEPQKCALTPLRIGPQRFYKIATIDNSYNLFAPPLRVVSIKSIKGGETAIDSKTDFHLPEIEVAFGTPEEIFDNPDAKVLLSLEANMTGSEATLDPNSTANITVTIGSKDYTAAVYIKKGFSDSNKTPNLCLYREQLDSFGNKFDKIISCVDRRLPEIDGVAANDDKRKVLVSLDPDNEPHDFKMNVQTMVSASSSDYDSCLDTRGDVCSSEIIFDNPPLDEEVCFDDIEKHTICAKRDSCSELVNECIFNESDLATLPSNDPSYGDKIAMKERCETILLSDCNNRWGIGPGIINSISDLLNNFVDNSLIPETAGDPNAYGWYNEVCLTEGFDGKLKKVLAYRAGQGSIMGKCELDSSANSDCNAGSLGSDKDGNRYNCPCLIVDDDTTINSLGLSENEYEIRTQTAREAGLCMDIPMPKLCPAITYQKNLTNPSDLSFLRHSVDNSIAQYELNSANYSGEYNEDDHVHPSHKDRKDDTLSGYAEFGAVFEGVNAVGVCNGFWKYKIDENTGLYEKPRLTCGDDGEWIDGTTTDPETGDTVPSSLENPCERYYCPDKSTSGMVSVNGVDQYTEDYPLSGESGETLGQFHGYANWYKFIKGQNGDSNNISDFLETVNANSCIVGFQATGNKLPNRKCGQDGNWLKADNACHRITCPGILTIDELNDIDEDIKEIFFYNANDTYKDAGDINPEDEKNVYVRLLKYDEIMSENSSLQQQYFNEWMKTKGAIFNQGKASRGIDSDEVFGVGSEVIGECYDDGNNLRFFEHGGQKPKRKCSHLGQWGEVINPCVTECEAINAPNEASGWAYWKKAEDVPFGGSLNVELDTSRGNGGCKEGYVYNNGYKPSRECISITSGIKGSSVWGEVNNPCVNYCPGASDNFDLGTTMHDLSNHGNFKELLIEWNRTDLGEADYQFLDIGKYTTNPIPTVADFDSVGKVFVKRECDANTGKWSDDVIALCSTNEGKISNASYDYTRVGGEKYLVAGSDDVVKGTCDPGYETGFDIDFGDFVDIQESSPIRKCVFGSGEQTIDNVYLALQSYADCKATCIVRTGDTFGDGKLIYDGVDYKMIDGPIAGIPFGLGGLKCSNSNHVGQGTIECIGPNQFDVTVNSCREGKDCTGPESLYGDISTHGYARCGAACSNKKVEYNLSYVLEKADNSFYGNIFPAKHNELVEFSDWNSGNKCDDSIMCTSGGVKFSFKGAVCINGIIFGGLFSAKNW